MSVTAVQISERRQKVKTTVSDESIKMRKFISMSYDYVKKSVSLVLVGEAH
mgnify:CR=1 FL=1